MRRLLTEAYLLLGEKDPAKASEEEEAPEQSSDASDAPKDSKSSPPDAKSKSDGARAKNLKRARRERDSVNDMVARVKRLRERYTMRARDYEKIAPSIAAATKDAKGRDLFKPNPNSTPSHSAVTDLTKGW